MDVLTAINSRASAIRLTEPGPNPEQLKTILTAATHAPDHGRLSPWRFVVLDGPDREILGKAMVDMRLRQAPETPAADAEREGLKAMRAPTIVVVAARTTAPSKVPEIERIVAVGAATQNMFLAAHALGLGAMWKTGDAAYDEKVKATLGLDPSDKVVAFLYLGTPASPGTPRETKLEDFVISK